MSHYTSHKDFDKNPTLMLNSKLGKGKVPIEVKEIIDKETGKTDINYSIKVGYAHPSDTKNSDGTWKTTPGPARFRLCETEKSHGIKYKKGSKKIVETVASYVTKPKYSDGTPNPHQEEVLSVCETMEHSRTLCYVQESDVKVSVGKVKVTSDKAKLYEKPDTKSKVLFTVEKKEKLVAPDPDTLAEDERVPEGDEDAEWVACYYGGTKGFLEKLLDAAARLVYDNRSEIKLADIPQRTESSIRNMFSRTVLHKKEDGVYVDTPPISFFNIKHFTQYPNGLAKFFAPQKDEKGEDYNEEIPVDLLFQSGFRSIDIFRISDIFVGAGRCKLRLQIDSGIITDLFEKKTYEPDILQDISSVTVDRGAMAEKLRIARENAEKNPLVFDEEPSTGDAEIAEGEAGKGLKELMGATETVIVENADADDSDDDNIEV